jgi:hypothetical protein
VRHALQAAHDDTAEAAPLTLRFGDDAVADRIVVVQRDVARGRDDGGAIRGYALLAGRRRWISRSRVAAPDRAGSRRRPART